MLTIEPGRNAFFRPREPPRTFAQGIEVLVGSFARPLFPDGKGALLDNEVIRRFLKIIICPETEVIILLLGGGVDPAAVVPAEGALLIVVGYDVLSQLRSHHLEEIAQVPDERKVTKDRMVPLQQVVDPNYEE